MKIPDYNNWPIDDTDNS